MVTKTLEEIVDEVSENFMYSLSFKPKLFALEVAKRVRKLTTEEIANTAEVTVVDFQYEDDSNSAIWGVDSDKILNLDLNKIQIW